MPNYYEIIKVQPTAPTAEIVNACEAQYNQWRRLVTHHDQDVVNQANQALQTIEQIRLTLTDTEKRGVYDAAVGIRGAIGGLADPEALLRAAPPLSTPPKPTATAPTMQRVDAWLCPKCNLANAIGTAFCQQCGTKISKECPNCNKRIYVSATHCPECGVNIDEFARKQGRKQEQIHQIESEISSLEQKVRRLGSSKQSYIGGGMGVFFLISSTLALAYMGAMLLSSAQTAPGGGLMCFVSLICGVILIIVVKHHQYEVSNVISANMEIDEQLLQTQQRVRDLTQERDKLRSSNNAK